MGFLKKAGTFSSIVSSLFGGKAKLAKRHGAAEPPPASPAPPPRQQEQAFLTTEDYRQAVQSAAAETAKQIERDLQSRFGGDVPPSRRSENLHDEWQKELAIEAHENMERRQRWLEQQQRSLDPDTRFLYGELVELVSSNVQWTQYDKERQLLYINFRNGATYVYYQVPADVALGLIHAASPGGYVWDVFRVRRTAWGYKYDYAFLEYNLGGYQPRYMSDEGYAREHAAIPPSGEPPAGWKISGHGPYADLPWYTKSPGKDADKHQLPTAKIFEEPEPIFKRA